MICGFLLGVNDVIVKTEIYVLAIKQFPHKSGEAFSILMFFFVSIFFSNYLSILVTFCLHSLLLRLCVKPVLAIIDPVDKLCYWRNLFLAG